MCGIAGIYGKNGLSEQVRVKLDRARKSLKTRGPDNSGTFIHPQIGLVHTRLAILDLHSGQQPWRETASNITLIFNGEIYNFATLRKELIAKNHQFIGHSDTEVLAKAYLEWGLDCIEHLRGMFAFAILDPNLDRLWLVRDRLGVKPLYYHYNAEEASFSFASNVATLLNMDCTHPEWDYTAVAHYLMTTRTHMADRTLLKGISTVQAGETLQLTLSSGLVKKDRYWRLPKVRPQDKTCAPSFDDCAQSIRDDILGITKEQVVSDVPLGIFLSGGLDSSVLANCLQLQASKQLHCSSIGYQAQNYNEWPEIEKTVQFNRLAWSSVTAEPIDFYPDWFYLIQQKGLPLSTPNEIPIWRLAKSFQQNHTVAMTGEGADEIFGGYAGPTFCAYDYDRIHGLHGGIDKRALIRAYGSDQFTCRREHFLHVNSWIKGAQLSELVPGIFANGREPLAEIHAHYDCEFELLSELSTFDAYLHLHANNNLECLLNRLDNSTMCASVEGRVPFTDHRLAEKIFTLPDHYKMQLQSQTTDNTHYNQSSFELAGRGLLRTKRLLRAAFNKHVHPDILQRPKMSFPVPFIEWFQSHLKENFRSSLRESPLLNQILSQQAMQRILYGQSP
ncbi:MAG: asparagine synthase (glutamine-hydrolyzing), partial [Opitutales bacterium]